MSFLFAHILLLFIYIVMTKRMDCSETLARESAAALCTSVIYSLSRSAGARSVFVFEETLSVLSGARFSNGAPLYINVKRENPMSMNQAGLTHKLSPAPGRKSAVINEFFSFSIDAALLRSAW